MSDETQLPILRVVQVRKAAFNQRAEKINRESRAFVSAQQQLRVGSPFGRSESGPIDHIAAIGWQGRAVARLAVSRARFGVLPGKTTNPDHAFFTSLHQHQAHLQEDLELASNGRRLAVGKTLGTIAALQKKPLAMDGLAQ